MEDRSTLKNEYSEVEPYCTLKDLKLFEEQRVELERQLEFKGCNLSYEHIWS